MSFLPLDLRHAHGFGLPPGSNVLLGRDRKIGDEGNFGNCQSRRLLPRTAEDSRPKFRAVPLPFQSLKNWVARCRIRDCKAKHLHRPGERLGHDQFHALAILRDGLFCRHGAREIGIPENPEKPNWRLECKDRESEIL